MLESVMITNMNGFIPTKNFSTRNNVPWMTHNSHRLLHKNKDFFNKATKTNQSRLGNLQKAPGL